MQQEKSKVFFPNLDGWRFVAFLAVFLVHCFHTDYAWQQETVAYEFIRHKLFINGDLGVSFFFVLSGFLITYLLLKEQEVSGKIHIGAFYVRRALRIWPLFYFCVFFGFVIFPLLKQYAGETPQETAEPWMYMLFLGNFSMLKHGLPDSSVLGVLWSVCVEEQFYLAWPLLLSITKKKHYPVVFLLVIGGSLGYRFFHHGYPESEWHTFCIISDMAIGGLSAWLMLNAPAFARRVRELPRGFLWLVYSIALLIFFLRPALFSGWMAVPERIITASVFALIILEQNFCQRSLFKMGNNKVFTRLGKYAYGLYCLHFIGLLVQIRIGLMLGLTSPWWTLLFGPLLGLALSIGLALTSYYLYERRFLLLKDRFAFVTRGGK